jgi:hypothetical protein
MSNPSLLEWLIEDALVCPWFGDFLLFPSAPAEFCISVVETNIIDKKILRGGKKL